MQDRQYAQTKASEELAEVHHFVMKKIDPGRLGDFHITVRHYAVLRLAGPHGLVESVLKIIRVDKVIAVGPSASPRPKASRPRMRRQRRFPSPYR